METSNSGYLKPHGHCNAYAGALAGVASVAIFVIVILIVIVILLIIKIKKNYVSFYIQICNNNCYFLT